MGHQMLDMYRYCTFSTNRAAKLRPPGGGEILDEKVPVHKKKIIFALNP
jgi:hypothetical protein